MNGAFSQGGIWTWISGSTNLADPGVYGTQGVPSVNNRPPANYEYVEWKDKSGNFWIYGGTYSSFNDLWKFNPQTLEWMWVKGDTSISQSAIFGIQGISDPQNTPGQRAYASTTWTDTSGNLWLFGGSTPSGPGNDLWKYDISINEWTWMKGSSQGFALGSHGIQGIPGPSVNPGARSETATGWTDPNNNLWLFGGGGMDDSGAGSGFLNDVMKYDISTNEWTWMNGSNLMGAPPSWGIKNIPGMLNDPGSRCTYSHWTDIQGGLWLMGGIYNISTTYFHLNDVWRLDLGTNIWTWKPGTDIFNDPGLYQTMCQFDSLSIPYSRYENRSGVQDNCGRHWFYGGINSQDSDFIMNDLWVFDPSNLDFALLWGSNLPYQPYNFGILGVPSSTNSPRHRLGASCWWGNDNRFYMFGGCDTFMVSSIIISMNDLWVYTPDSSCISPCQPLANTILSSDSICPGTCIDFTNLSLNASSFQWFFPGGIPSSSTSVNPQTICYTTPGNYDVTLIAANASDTDTLVLTNYITVFPQTSLQGITQSGDTLFSNQGFISYQWYHNGNFIHGATDYFLAITDSGYYNVISTDSNHCEVEAVIYDVHIGINEIIPFDKIFIYPNPVTETLTFNHSLLTGFASEEISIYNMLGEKILLDFDSESMTVNCRPLNPGIYSLS
jgi:hypothetical protein